MPRRSRPLPEHRRPRRAISAPGRSPRGVAAELAGRRERVLAFDQHPITLAALAGHLHVRGVDAVVATGSDPAARQRVERLFHRAATGRAVALCSDALNEGLNLQGAAGLVRLDLPTILRVADSASAASTGWTARTTA